MADPETLMDAHYAARRGKMGTREVLSFQLNLAENTLDELLSSQWFALLYLNPLDRLIKEPLRVKAYSRYMDDMVLIHESKDYLIECLHRMREVVADLGLRFNEKTQISPLRDGIAYLGFHSYLTPTGAVCRRVPRATVQRMRRAMVMSQESYATGEMTARDVHQRIQSYIAHMKHGSTYALRQTLLSRAVWRSHFHP